MKLPRRLRKLLRDETHFSLGELDHMIGEGRVSVAGQRAQLDDEGLVYPEDEVLVDSQPLNGEKDLLTFLLHKPRAVTTTARDPDGKRDLNHWLRQLPPGSFPIGRLDRATTGALLLTTDGDLANALLRPDHQTDKLYWLWLNEHIAPDDDRLRAWKTGIPLRNHTARATRTEIVYGDEHSTQLHVTLQEGKNRQIRRMCRASDFRLLHLHRKSVGPISLESLREGEMRQLSMTEVSALWEASGGRAEVTRKQLEALGERARRARQEGKPLHRLESWLSCHSPGTS